MNIIFLDMDGVLTSDRLQDQIEKEKGELEYEDYFKFDPIAVENLKKIINATDAKIVVSSSWRGRAIKRLENIGLGHCITGVTEHIWESNATRGMEIQCWMDKNKEIFNREKDNFIIIDDNSNMGELLPYLIQTDGKYGIAEEDAEKAINLFNSQKSKDNKIGLNILPNLIEKHLNNIEKGK